MEKLGGSPGISPGNTGGYTNQSGTGIRLDYSTTAKEKFLLWEKASRDTIELKRIYVDITDDLITGLLLSQIIYWHLPSKEQRSKLTIERDGKRWLAKGRDEWWNECRISPKQYDRAITILEKKSLVDTATYKFKGNPTKHISLNWDNLLYQFEQKLTEQSLREGEIFSSSQEQCPASQDSSVFYQKGKTNFPKGEKGISSKGKLELDERVRTYIRNTETTAETTKDIIKNNPGKFEQQPQNGNQPLFFEKVSEETFSPSFSQNKEKIVFTESENGSAIEKIDQPLEGIKKGGEKSNNSNSSNEVRVQIKTLRERYSEEELHVIDLAIDAFASTRKNYQLSEQIILNHYRKWQQHPVSQVIEGLTIYLEKGCAVEGKAEDYALGIIRMLFKQKNLPGPKEVKSHEAKPATGFKNSGWEKDKKYGDMYIIPDMS